MDKFTLVNLCSRSWSLTALALVANGVPLRVSPLAAAAGCGRTSMGASIEHIVRSGFLIRNPGHGHPLRAEYKLTQEGEYYAEWAAQLISIANTDKDKELIRNKWSLPLLYCLPEERRYSEIRRELNPVTDRALSACLSNLSDHSWLQRNVLNTVSPPTVSYQTIKIGKNVQRHLARMPLSA